MQFRFDSPGAVACAKAENRLAERQAIYDSTHAEPAPAAPALRLTVSAAYRFGSEVLLVDSDPLSDLVAVHDALSTIINTALDTHADLLFECGAELLVLVAERQFEHPYPSTERAHNRSGHRIEF